MAVDFGVLFSPNKIEPKYSSAGRILQSSSTKHRTVVVVMRKCFSA